MSSARTLVDEPAHWLYTGTSLTGKTTLARWHARILSRAKYHVVVYDPVGTPTKGGDWPEDAQRFDDRAKFIAFCERVSFLPEHPAFVFVDEAADVYSLATPETHWMLRRGRHRHMYMRVISQRPKMLAPNVRSQCTRVFMFRLAADDAREVCADVGHGRDVYSIQLDTGDCVMMQSGSAAIEKFNCFRVIP